MGKTIPQSGSPALFFLDELHRAGLKDRDIDGAVSDDAVGGPAIGVCREGAAKDGKVDKGEIFATAFNNLVKHGDTLKRYFQKIGLNEISHLQNDGQLEASYREGLQKELLSAGPQRSLRAWPNPKKLAIQDPAYASELLQWASRHTRLPLLPYKEQVSVLKQLDLEEGRVKGELGKLWQGQTLPKMVAHASVLRGEEMQAEAKARRAVGDAKEAQALEQSALRLFRTAVEMDGHNPDARRRLAEGLEAQGRFREAGLHYGQALASEPTFEGILDILGRLSGPNGPEMLGKSHDAFSFVASALKGAGRYPEAALIFHRAAEAATLAGHHEQSLAFTEQEMLAQEATAPYLRQFSSESNPVANALYGALRDAGIPSALIDGASGKEGDVPDRKIGAAEVFGYLDGHWGDARVQAALKKIHFHVPWLDAKGQLKKSFDTLEFSKQSFAQRMGAWHASEAAALRKAASPSDGVVIEKHLKMAAFYEPETVARHRALGDFYLAKKDAPHARDAYFAALAVDPGDISLQLPLGRSLSASGDPASALKAYDSYLETYPEDGPARFERSGVSSQYLGTLLKKFDEQMSAFKVLREVNPDQATKALGELEATKEEIFANSPATPEQSLERMKRLSGYYSEAIQYRNAHSPSRNFWDDSTYKNYETKTQELQTSLKELKTEMRDLRDKELLPATVLSPGTTPDAGQISKARLMLAIDEELGGGANKAEDLDRWAALVHAAPAEVLTSAQRTDQLTAILKGWNDLKDPENGHFLPLLLAKYPPSALDDRMKSLKADILAASPAAVSPAGKEAITALLDSLLEKPQLRLADYLSAEGLAGYAKQSLKADADLRAAEAMPDVKERRGASLGVLAQYARLGQSAKAEALAQRLETSLPEDAKDSDRLQMTTAMLAALKGNGFPAEARLAKKGAELARLMPAPSASPRTRVERLLLAKAYYDAVGDAQGRKDSARDLNGVRDELFNFLHFGNPKEGIPKPTDAKTRVEIAALSVELDLNLMPTDVEDTADPKARGSIALSILPDRLDVLRRELEAAQDLAPEERLKKIAFLNYAASAYLPLTKGDKPLVDPDELEAVTDAAEPLMEKVFEDLLQLPDSASPAKQKMAAAVVSDLKARYRTAVDAGDAGWLSNVTPQSVLEFAKYSQSANALLLDAGDGKGPRAMQRRLQAAQVFSQLGLKERVKESLAPLQAYAKQLSDPKKMAGLSFNLAQLYQGAGMTSEANAALQAIVDLGGPSAAPEYRELGTLARGVQQLNRGEVKEARETFAGIPQNPVAQTFLVSLQEGARKNRFAMAVGVLRSVSLNFLERGKESTFGGFSKEEYESLSRDTLGAWDEVQKLLIGGDAANIDEAIADVQASGRFPGFRTGFSTNYGVDPHEKDTSEFHVASSVRDFLAALDNPATGDLDLAKSALELGSRLEADGYYSAAGGIYSFMGKDPLVQADAKARLDSLPASIKVRTGIGIAWNVISFAAGPAGIIGANSTSSAGGGDYVENVAMALVPFGIARAFAVGAEAIYVAKTASLIRNPMLFKAGGFLVGKTAEAAGFTLGNMAMLSLLKGRSDQWTWGHFGKEFGTMLVTFMLLHGAGAALQGLGRSSKGAVARAEADLARALESGSGVSSAVSRLRLARGVESVSTSGITAWGVRVSAFTGSDYFNEAIGLKDPEPGIPFGVRLFSSAVMDAQMIVAGKSIDALSGGRLGKLEKATQEKYFEHQVGYETERLLPLVEGLGLDAKSPAGRQVLQGLLTARLNGESLVDLQGRTSPEERAAYEKAVSEHWGLDPKSAEGQQALAQLLGYGQSHPFAAGGRPLSAAEVVELTGKLDAEGSRLLLAAGIERGPHFESLRRGLLGFALQTGMEVSQLGVYAKQATALKAPLRGLAEQLLGQDGAKTPEGQNLMGELAVYAMLRASAPEKLAETLEGLGNKEWGADVRAELRGRAEALFGKGGEETPSGREWMTRLFLRGLYGSEQPSEILPALQAGVEAGRELASLADVASLARPKERLALAIWALERGVDAEVLKGTTTMVLKGQIEFRVEQGRIRVFEVPKEQQAAKASEVRDRLPELPSELLREDRAATARAGEEILPVTEDMIVSDEPKVADSDATKPGKKIKPIETTVAGKRKTVEALAARKGMTSKPSAEVPIVLDAKEGMTVLPRVEGPIPDVELRVGEERLKLSFEAGDVIPLEEKAGKLNFGAEVKEAKGEIAVLRNEHGELAFYFRTVGEAKGQELQPGDKLRVGDVEFLWEGPQNRPKPELKSVPLEPTKNEGLPKADKPPTLQGKIGLSETEISAHAFLDFYFGEEGSIKTLDAFVARSQGSERNSWVDAAVDFRRTLGSFQTKVAEYDALEKDFDLHRANFLDAKGKDPEKAKESAHLAEEALKARGELELEIARDLKALTKEPYNQLELQYNARVSKAEKEAIPLDFALAAAEVEAAIASRGTDEKQALHYQLVFTPLGEISENHYDYEFNRLPLGELAHAEVHVTRWEVAERTLQQMVDEGVLKPEQLPDFEALRAGGAKEFEVSAEIPGSGKMRVVFHFEGKVEEPSGATPSEGGKSGGLGLTGALLGLTTLLTPEIARASDGAAGGGDASLLPWVLGVGAALLTAAGGAYLWAKARPESKTSEQDGDALRKRRSSAADKISESKPLTQGPVKIPTGKGVGGDLLSFLGDRPSLVDRAPVPGIDRKEMRRLESIFEKGGDLMEMELPDGSKLTRLVELVTGAATMNAMPVGEEVVQFFKQWKKENGFRPVDALTARRAWKELNQRAKKAGIQIEFGGPTVKGRAIDPKELQEKIDYQGAPIAYLNELMKLLPDSMLNNPRLKHLYLDTGRQGAGELSCYEPEQNAVYLFHGAFRGSRRYLAALFFHEIGHSTAERYKPGAAGDPTIPGGIRDQMAKSVEILSRKKAMLGLDWSLGAEDRAAYQTGSITEFLAELNLMYVTAGPKLRAHIESFPEGSPERQAWDFAYGEMKSRIFEGIEYGYDADYRPAASVKSAKPAGKKAEVPAPEKTEILPVQINTPPPKPVIGTVEMALADNAPGAGRKGKAGKSQGTEEYGTFSVITDEGTGYHKDHNEDGYVLGRNWGLVLDGMGGMGSGDKASEIAGKKFAEEMSAHGDLLRATLAAGRAINESPYHSGGTTSVAHQIVKRADGTYVAKLVVTGDAAAILFRRDANGKYVYDPKLRTEEQSQAALLRKAGRITNTLQARASDIANVVTGGLGLGREAKPDTYEYEIRKGDYLLSFSDGIGDNVSGEELARILNNSRSAGEVQDKISDLVHWKMEKLAKARAVAKGRSQEGVMVDSFVDSEDRFHWRVELNDMPGYTIDEKGHVYDSAGKMVDHYKSDNLTIHVYSHDVLEPPAGRASEVTVTMPVVDIADQKTLILQLPKVEPRWTSNGEWVLPKGFRSTTIGSDRSKGAQILMPDPLVSRQHAEIFESEGELWIRDKGSLNGTFVDGKRLSGEEAHVLDSGTLVSFGGRSYQFDVVGDQAKLTPVLAVSPGQGTVNFGGITLLEGDPGVYFIRNEGKGPVQVDGASLEANGQAYRIRDRESVKLGQQNFIFRIQ